MSFQQFCEKAGHHPTKEEQKWLKPRFSRLLQKMQSGRQELEHNDRKELRK